MSFRLADAKLPTLPSDKPGQEYWGDRDAVKDIKSAINFMAPTKKDAVMNSVFTYPLYYFLAKALTTGGGLPSMLLGKHAPNLAGTPEIPAALLTGLTAAGSALQFMPKRPDAPGAWDRPTFDTKADDSYDMSVSKGVGSTDLFGKEGAEEDKVDFVKVASEFRSFMGKHKLFDAALDMPINPNMWARPAIGVRQLRRAVDEADINSGQRMFLQKGVGLATGGKRSGLTSFNDLTVGTAQAMDDSGMIKEVGSAATRLAEGAYLAKAFAPIAGFSPEATTWISRVNSVSNALLGSKLFRSLK